MLNLQFLSKFGSDGRSAQHCFTVNKQLYTEQVTIESFLDDF